MIKNFCSQISLRRSLAVAALAFSASLAQAATFSGRDMQLVGSASVLAGGDLQLTPGATDLAGAAWMTTALSTTEDFSANFSFTIAASQDITIADGIAFVLQGGGTGALGNGGGGIGFEGLDAVGSVIHTFGNNHVGLNAFGDPFSAPAAPIDPATAAPVDLGGAQLITGFQNVGYDAANGLLVMTGAITVDGVEYEISDSLSVNLATRFGSTMYVGFTGATGSAWSDQRVNSWSIAPVPEPESYALMIAGLGLVGWKLRRRVVA